ncbi:MAG: efflux RND transporter permease subunit [Candidatus Hydrogenedentes bacterium]|nr:efflux RND transporter permease subunit [Candidatus Hydrogenedentota bacterium]
MIESIIEFSCRNKAIVIIGWLAVAGYGIYITVNTPVDAIPDLSENQVIVFTDWMGRSPKEIEDQITYPLSVNLQGLAGVKAVRSSSEFNFSMINIIFDDSVDFYFARTRVLERLALANTFLPQGVIPYLAPDATALGQIFWYTVEGDNQDLGTLRAIQDWYVRYQLNAVPGVAQVSSVGGMPQEYQVDITPERLRAYNVTLGQIYSAIEKSNSAVGGRVVQKGNAEYLIRGVGWIESIEDIRNTVVTVRNSVPVLVSDVATVQMGPEFRRSVLEKDGHEVVGGVVMMRYGENPLEVTRAIKDKIRQLQTGMPAGVSIVPFYDRTQLIEGAIHTVTRILEHEIVIAAVAILLILVHVRSVFVVIITLPLSILVAFILMSWFGISSNIMSLSGIAISIGILVDQAIVMLENATHRLTEQFGDKPIRGDTTEIVVGAMRQVGRPIFFSVVIMVISFLPVFALSGQEGKLFHPLAFTKTFALIGTAIISVTLVPALIPMLIRGRLSREDDNWLIRSVIEMYRPVLGFLMEKPKTVVWLFVLLLAFGFYTARHLGREFMPPLDEGSILDMPITVPRASVTEVGDDLKARDALLRAVPEVSLVVGKAGRADTPTDPSPLDMVETVVNLHPRDHWIKRKIRLDDAFDESDRLLASLESAQTIERFANEEERKTFLNSTAVGALDRFDTEMRTALMGRLLEYQNELGDESIRFVLDDVFGQIDRHKAWGNGAGNEAREHLLHEMRERFRPQFARQAELLDVEQLINASLQSLERSKSITQTPTQILAPKDTALASVAEGLRESFGIMRDDFYKSTYAALIEHRYEHTTEWAKLTNRTIFDPAMLTFAKSLLAELEYQAGMQNRWHAADHPHGVDPNSLAGEIGDRIFLWVKSKTDLIQELDKHVRQIGWANIWTQPIINRVDMLATGVRTQLAVKVFGHTQQEIQEVSNKVADVLRSIEGAVDVVADQTVGKGYIEIHIDRVKAARYGLNVGDIQDTVEVALGGKPITTTVEGRERFPVRLRYARDYRDDEEAVQNILISRGGMEGPGEAREEVMQLPSVRLIDVADVSVVEGPVMIKSENGLLRAYVQLNVRDRDIVGFVEEAQREVSSRVSLPEGMYLEWTGQFEHQVRAKRTLRIVFPAVLLLIFVILYMTYRDFVHASLMMMAVPGALAGGVIFQTLFGYNFSVAVWVGYIACFGMATETGIIMLVYLRAAIEERGGLVALKSVEELKNAVMTGAVHRLRPKFLTEATAIVGLAPMLWASGVGAEVIAPMAAPVLGGLLVADEVIDIFLPVLFYHVEKRRWLKLQRNQPPAVAQGVES